MRSQIRWNQRARRRKQEEEEKSKENKERGRFAVLVSRSPVGEPDAIKISDAILGFLEPYISFLIAPKPDLSPICTKIRWLC